MTQEDMAHPASDSTDELQWEYPPVTLSRRLSKRVAFIGIDENQEGENSYTFAKKRVRRKLKPCQKSKQKRQDEVEWEPPTEQRGGEAVTQPIIVKRYRDMQEIWQALNNKIQQDLADSISDDEERIYLEVKTEIKMEANIETNMVVSGEAITASVVTPKIKSDEDDSPKLLSYPEKYEIEEREAKFSDENDEVFYNALEYQKSNDISTAEKKLNSGKDLAEESELATLMAIRELVSMRILQTQQGH